MTLRKFRELIKLKMLKKPKLLYTFPPRRKRDIEDEIKDESMLIAAFTGGNVLARGEMITVFGKMAYSVNKYMAKGYSLNINLPKES